METGDNPRTTLAIIASDLPFGDGQTIGGRRFGSYNWVLPDDPNDERTQPGDNNFISFDVSSKENDG